MKRQQRTRLITFLCCFLSLFLHASASAQATADKQDRPLRQAQDRPNVVFILSDDQSWDDYGFMGHPQVKTPNLDRLAGEGLTYERGYTTAAI